MEQKRCSTCKAVKPVDDFAVSRRARDGRQSRCRSCWRDWYAAHREEHIALVEQRRAQVRADHQQRLVEHLIDHPCVDCAEADLRVLDFDHDDPAAKVADVARLISMNIAWERIAAEIDKCAVRCANCHRRRTAVQLGYWRDAAETRRRTDAATAVRARLTALLDRG